MRARALAYLASVVVVGLTACDGAAGSAAHDGHDAHARAVRDTPALVSAPPPGSRAEAAALARQLMSRWRVPAGAQRLSALPVPEQWLREPGMGEPPYREVDLHRLFALSQPISEVAATFAATRLAGLGPGFGNNGGYVGGGIYVAQVSFADRSLPAGIYAAQVALTAVPAPSGGTLLREDSQVAWYPPRSPAEYIDPARYHALTITVFLGYHGRLLARRVVTSQAVISRFATFLDRSRAEPIRVFSCMLLYATNELAFSASPRSGPAVVVRALQAPCEGTQITVGGRTQPLLQGEYTIDTMTDQLLGITQQELANAN
jgi:hypothetical protein